MPHPLLTFLFIALIGLFACSKSNSCVDPDKYNPNISCPPYFDPVCGCDDIQYRNACEAERNGVVFWINGPC